MSLRSAHKNLPREKPAYENPFRLPRWVSAVVRPYLAPLIFVILLLAGAYFRFQSINWDDGQHLHPDERFLTMVETGIRWPSGLEQYFQTAESPLNPYNAGFHSYVYGTFPLFLTKAVASFLQMTGYDEVHLVGRALSGVMDLVSIVFIFLIGRKLFSARVGLLAAVLLTLTVFNIQQSHFFTVDMAGNLMIVIAMYFAIHVAKGGRWFNFLGLGIAFGLAAASKINLALFGLVIVLACAVRFLGTHPTEAVVPAVAIAPQKTAQMKKGKGKTRPVRQPEPAEEPLPPSAAERAGLDLVRLRRPLFMVFGSLALILVISLLVFRIAQPYAFSGPGFFGIQPNPTWVDDLRATGRLISGEGDYPAGHQWAFRTPYLFPWLNMVKWGMGWGLGLSAWLGLALAAWELVARKKFDHLLLVVWIVTQFFVLGGGFVLTMRYFLPIYPFLVLLAAYLLVWLWEHAHLAPGTGSGLLGKMRLSPRTARLLRPAAGALIAAVVLTTFLWALAFTAIYRQPVSRVAASRWIYANVPQGTAFAWEHWDDPLPLRVDGRDTAGYYTTVELPLYAEDTPEKLYGYAGQPDSGLLDKLDKVDWIFISSARLYTSIPRLPMRYPMTTRYYQALFSGELGFERVKTFNNFPALAGIVINDQGAEEQFTVYDHPQVDLFRKTPAFSREKAAQLLGNVNWDSIQKLSALNASRVPGGLMLSPTGQQVQQAGGTWSEMFNRLALANQNDLVSVLAWLLALQLVSLAVLPLALLAFGNLADRGYLLAKPLGLLLVSYLAWLAASLTPLPFTRWTVLLALAVVGTAGGALWSLQPPGLVDFFRSNKRLIILEEGFFLLFFVAFVLVRRENPDLWRPWTGGEKPMDFAYLNAILKSTHFPPYDPWFAGGYLNYYYLGFVQVATLIKLTGIVPWIAYNLALPTLFAMTASGAFCIVYNLLRGQATPLSPRRAAGYGLLGALFVAVLGNLGQVKLISKALRELGQLSSPSGLAFYDWTRSLFAGLAQWAQGKELPVRLEWWYWNATRVIPGGVIEEFPFFSFLYGDLHAHVMSLPLTLLALGGVVNVIRMPNRPLFPRPMEDGLSTGQRYLPLLSLGVLALTIGALKPANTWDFPTYLLLGFAGLAIWGFNQQRSLDLDGAWIGILVSTLTLHFILGLDPTISLALGIVGGGVYGLLAGRRAALAAGLVALASFVFFLPFSGSYFTPYNSLELWSGDRTTLVDYLTIHGVFLFVIAAYLAVEWVCWLKDQPVRATIVYDGRRTAAIAGFLKSRAGLALASLAFLAALAIPGLILKVPVAALALPLAVLAGGLMLRSTAENTHRFTLFLILTGLLLTSIVELVVLKGDIGRSNTVFKFYLQVWVLWGCAAATAFPKVWAFLNSLPGVVRRLWGAGFSLLLLGAALYPLLATPANIKDRFNPQQPATLNGMAFMQNAVYDETDAGGNPVRIELKYDQDALVWMQDHIVGSPVIAEANSPYLYHWTGRVSVWTGLPSILGYNWHQKQQRAAVGGETIDRREQQANLLFQTTDESQVISLIRRFNVRYIYVGPLERAFYPAAGLEKFDQYTGQWLELAYENPQVRIYQVDETRLGSK